ncbi:3856_t:CDS:10 [Funneliformis mosseae]|uniref:3856_t:CDS:1 n=1 Tax=Funneliformis mosseae TaxID=27381 RepID=A0A9N8YM15_FUNMO|nr:3856_t:CDS:10 [Funneliformis mosseae]
MTPTKVLKDLSVDLTLTLPPNNAPTRLTIQIKKDQLLMEVVRRFMNAYNVPCYLENSILSIIESLMVESWRKDAERDSKIQDELDATRVRENLIAKYKKYTIRYNESPAENIFPKAYHTLVHSPVPSLFDSLLQLEQCYKEVIKDLVSSKEKELEGIMDRHQKEMEPSQTSGIVNLLMEKHREVKIVIFVTLHVCALDSHQRWLIANQSTTDPNWVFQLDVKEIVGEVITDMKKCHKGLSKQILQLVQGSGTRSRHGSISSLSDIILSPTLMSPTSPSFNEDKKPAYFNEDDLRVLKIQEMGFNQKQAIVALEMTKGNMEHAVSLLIEQPDKINNQIANASAIIPRRPSVPFVSSPLKEQPESIGKRSKSQRRTGLTILTKQEKKTTWSPINFFQQKHQMLGSPNTSTSSVRKFSGWLGRKSLEGDGNGLEYFYINCSIPCSIAIYGKICWPIINVDPFFSFHHHNYNQKSQGSNLQIDNLVESFTISLGNQVKSTHNLRLLVSETEDLLNSSNDIARDMAYRAQTAANLYSQNLTAIVLLLTPSDWPNYKLGRSANKGDFFITRHSNLPLIHVVFHLVIESESIQKSELTPRSNAISGLRNILRTIDRFDITTISLPILLLPSHVDVFTATDQADESLLIRRGEVVLKCTKGFMMNNSRTIIN